MITYSPVKKAVVKTLGETKYTSILDVSLERKVVGQIYQRWATSDKWQDFDKHEVFVYIPKGKKTGGDEFTNLDACKRSLE